MNKNLLTRIAKRFLIQNGYYQLDKDAHTSFSQMAEDLILERLFQGKKRGFYVDVGAFNPKLYSNTYLFYLRGWRGINIDAMPGSMTEFNKIRPKDINIEAAVSNNESEATYYITNSGALNTLSLSRKREIDTLKDHKITDEIMVNTVTLKSLLDKYLPKKKNIDFLNIDVEGSDVNVLKSNDWFRHKPSVVIVESLSFSLGNLKNDKIYHYLISLGYELEAKTGVSLIFKLKNR